MAILQNRAAGGTGVSFLKGTLANLPPQITEGAFYITTDERAMYLDIDAEHRIRIGDFQEFNTLAELQANTNPSTTALYYVADMNCLAKWDGAKYVQINPDTGMTSVETVGDGNAVTAASYNPVTRKLTLTLDETYMTGADVDQKIADATGDLEGKQVKTYVDDKIADVVAGSIEGLGALAAKDKVAEGDLEDALAQKLNGKADAANVYTKQETDEAIAAKVASTYKPAGSITFAELPAASADELGRVYNITDAFSVAEDRTDILAPAGSKYPAGTNIVCVETQDGAYAWDVLSGFVDLSGYDTADEVDQKIETAVGQAKAELIGTDETVQATTIKAAVAEAKAYADTIGITWGAF